MRHIACALLYLIAASNAAAEPAGLAPADWTRAEKNGLAIYAAPSGVEAMLVVENPATDEGPMAVVQAAAKSVAEISGGKIQRSKMYFERPMAVFEFEFAKNDSTMTGAAFGVDQANGMTLGLVHIGAKGTPGFDARNADARAKMASLAAGAGPEEKTDAPGSKSVAAPKAAPATAVSPAAHPENWDEVESVYFRSYTGFGVGGMPTFFNYGPLVFFRDGSYYEIENAALEDIDLAASRRAAPEKWGRWTKSGSVFTLTDNKGESSQEKLQDGSFFKAFPAEAGGGKLAGEYKRVSGGGDSALGGEMTIAVQTNLTFTPDGRYMRASSVGAVGSGDATGVASSAYSRSTGGVGRYSIERHTITLTEPDGQSQRQFFAFSSRKTPPQPATDMIFVGDRTYLLDD